MIGSLISMFGGKALESLKEMEGHEEHRELDQELKIFQLREKTLIERMSTGEAGSLWEDMRGLVSVLKEAVARKDLATLDALQIKFDSLTQTAVALQETWEELLQTMERKSKMLALDDKRILEKYSVLRQDQAAILFAGIMQICIDNIKANVDMKTFRKVIRGIQAEVQKIKMAGMKIEAADIGEDEVVDVPGSDTPVLEEHS